MKKLAACLAMVKDEGTFMPFWLRHYSQHFSPSDLHVHSDGSTDSTVDQCRQAGANVTEIAPGTVLVGHNDRYVKQVISGLLQDYQCVLFAESPDDIISPPDGDLRAYLQGFASSADQHRFLTAINVTHRVGLEPDFSGQLGTLLSQRSHGIRCPQYDNPFLWKSTPTWGRGWHDLGGPRLHGMGDGSLWNVHIHYADFQLCNARHAERKRRYTAEQQRMYACWTDEQLQQIMGEMWDNPRKWFRDGQTMSLPEWMRTIA